MYQLSNQAKILILLMLTVVMVWFSPARSSMAEGESYQRDEIDSSFRLQPVSLNGSSTIEMKSASVLPADGGRTLFFAMSVINGDSRALSFLDYWIKVYDSSGAEYTVDLIPQDKLKKEVPAGQRVDFSFYAPVNESTQLEDLTFRIMRWDYTSPLLEQPLGQISFTNSDAGNSIWAPIANVKNVWMSGQPVQLEVTKWSAGIADNYASPKLTVKLTNLGKAGFKLQSYQYALRSSNGAMYQLEITSNGDRQLVQPEVPLELALKATHLPVSAETETWDLLISQPISINTESKLAFPVASLRIPTNPLNLPGLGDSVEYVNVNGTYLIKAERVDRLPWEDQDILSADISLTHNQADALPFPEFKAYFELDGGVKVDAKIVKTDRSVGVPPGTSVHAQLIAKIPYTYPFSSTKLFIQEKISDSVTDEMAHFLLPPSIIQLPVIAFGESQAITGAGRLTRYSPREINSYSNGPGKLFEAQVEVSNLEKRSNAIPRLTAFFKAPDDSLYPTKVREIKQKLNPQGKALVSFYTTLPKELETGGFKLVIGESITDQHLSGTDEKADAYINTAAMELPQENRTISPVLKDVSFYPYTISLANINTWLDRKELRINFQYKLTKDSYYMTSREGDKLIIQFEDSGGKVSIEESFYLETAPEDVDKRLKLGLVDYRMGKVDDSLVLKIESLKTYKMSIFHEYQGERKLLASQTMDWFGTTD